MKLVAMRGFADAGKQGSESELPYSFHCRNGGLIKDSPDQTGGWLV